MKDIFSKQGKASLRYVVYISMVLSIVLFVVSFFYVRDTRLNYDMESFFSAEDDEVQFYQSFKSNFENENDYLQIGITRNKGVLDSLFLSKVTRLTAQIGEVDGVQNLISPTSAKRKLKVPFGGFTNIPVIHLNDPDRYDKDIQITKTSNDFYSTLVSEDLKNIRILVKLEDSLNTSRGQHILYEIGGLLEDQKFEHTAIAGRIATQGFYLKEMRSEMLLFGSVVLLILIVALFFLLRSIYFGVLTFLIVSGGILGTFALINITGNAIDLMVIMTPAILLIIGSSSSIHFFSDVQSRIQAETNRWKSIIQVFTTVGIPIFLNTLTTAAGFAVLSIIPIAPIQKFGLFSAFGILFTFVFLIGFGTIGVLLYNPASQAVRRRKRDNQSRFPPRRIVSISLLGVSIVGLFLLPGIKASNYFLEDLKEGSDLKRNLVFFEQHFDGVRPFELVVHSKLDKGVDDYQFVKKMESFSEKIRVILDVKYMHSALSYLKSGNMAMHSNSPEAYSIPENESSFNKLIRNFEKIKVLEKSSLMHENSFRFSCRTSDLGSAEMARRVREIERIAKEDYPEFEISVTGVAHLIDKTNASLSYYLIHGILISVFISILISLLVTRSFKLALIGMIPNLIPLLAAVILLRLTDTSLNIGTAMIFTVIFGIAVDDTMHFIYRYHLFLKAEEIPNVQEALKKTLLHLKRPMMNTTILLASGFLVFTLSGFNSISTMGLIVSVTLVIALLADMFLLPLLIDFNGIKFNK